MKELIIRLTHDDVFELRLLRERAEKEARGFKVVGQSGAREIYTDSAREAMHAAEMLNRILKQV